MIPEIDEPPTDSLNLETTALMKCIGPCLTLLTKESTFLKTFMCILFAVEHVLNYFQVKWKQRVRKTGNVAHCLWSLVSHPLFAKGLNWMPRALKVSCPLIANMKLFVNISNFCKCFFFHIMAFSVAHWDT